MSVPGRKRTLLERLFAQQGGALRHFIGRRVRNAAVAADLTQEVYLRMLRVDDTEVIRNAEAYLFTIARNLLHERETIERRRGEAVPIDDPELAAELSVYPTHEHDIDRERRLERMAIVLKELSDQRQAIVALAYGEQLTQSEVAELLGIPQRRVREHLSEILALLRKRMARFGG